MCSGSQLNRAPLNNVLMSIVKGVAIVSAHIGAS